MNADQPQTTADDWWTAAKKAEIARDKKRSMMIRAEAAEAESNAN